MFFLNQANCIEVFAFISTIYLKLIGRPPGMEEIMIPVIDMHCDSFSKMKEETDAGKGFVIRENAKHIDLVRMKEAGYMCQNFALFTFLGHWMGGQGPYADMNLMEFVTALSDLFDEQIGQLINVVHAH